MGRISTGAAINNVSGGSGGGGSVTQGTVPWVVSNGGTFPVQATLTAETTKVIGTTRITDTLGNSVSAFPATFLRTTDEPHQLFYDAFDTTIDVTNRWTSTTGNSGVAASNTTGVMSMGTGTVSAGFSKLISQPTFTLPIPAWLGVSDAVALPDGAAPIANSYRYWGTGTTPGTPTVAAPVTDGYGFELNTDGKLRAVVYTNGVRTVVQDLSTSGNSTQPLDASYHRYIIYIRTDRAYWYIDGLTSTQLVATSNFQSSAVQTLPRLFLCVGNTSPPASNTQIQCTGATAWDTGKNNLQMSDGVFPWRKATVEKASTAIAATDLPLAVGLHPTSPLPTGNNVIGHVIADSGSTTAVTQATGTNLHTVVDSGTITTVTTLTGTTTLTPGTGTTNLGKAEDAAHSSSDVGVAVFGVRESTPTDLSAGNTDGDYEPFQVGAKGGMWVSQSAEASGGVSVATGSISNTKTDIGTANTPGAVFGWYFYNSNAAVAYVQFFNTQASGVTLGTTPPVYSFGIPAGSAANVMNPMGIKHATAISIAITTTRAGSTGNSSTVDYNVYYKQ